MAVFTANGWMDGWIDESIVGSEIWLCCRGFGTFLSMIFYIS